jgi:hypothetical protein
MLNDARSNELKSVKGAKYKTKIRITPISPEDYKWQGIFFLLLFFGAGAAARAQVLMELNDKCYLNHTDGLLTKHAGSHAAPVHNTAGNADFLAANTAFFSSTQSIRQPLTPVTKPKPANRVIDASFGKFPQNKNNQYVAFHIMQNIMANKSTINDLNNVLNKHGKRVLNVELDLVNIEEGGARAHFHPVKMKGERITPVVYALLRGRVDLFSLLLARGAGIYSNFTYETTSFSDYENEQSKWTGDLVKMYLTQKYSGEYTYHPLVSKMRNELFLTLLERRKYKQILEIMMAHVKRVQDQHQRYIKIVKDYDRGVDSYNLDYYFNHLPAPEIIIQRVGVLPTHYLDTLDHLIDELEIFIDDASARRGLFFQFKDDAIKRCLTVLYKYLSCFNQLRSDIDPNLTLENYRKQKMAALLAHHEHYVRDLQKERYLASIEKTLGAPHANGLKDMLSTAKNLADNADTPLYRETLIGYVADQLSEYGAHMQELAAQMKASLEQGCSDQLKTVLNEAVSHIENSRSRIRP